VVLQFSTYVRITWRAYLIQMARLYPRVPDSEVLRWSLAIYICDKFPENAAAAGLGTIL
jgi:hypothetical protein